jgi:hypothetical protein
MKSLICVVAAMLTALCMAVGAFAGDAKRFKATDSGTFTVTPTAVPGVVLTRDIGSGRGSHIGEYTFVAQELVNLVTFQITNGLFTITTHRGTISGTYSGHAGPGPSPGSITWEVSGPITGGTGKFAGARGAITYRGLGIFTSATTGTLSEVISGTLSLPRGDDDE